MPIANARACCAAFVFAALTVFAFTTGAAAQAKYPERPVRIIVPFASGGATDVIARTVAQSLQEAFGQSFVVENRPGAGSNLGAAVVARSEPDGHTLLLASSAIIAAPALYRNLSYDIFKDLAPVAELFGSPNIFVSNVSAGINSVAELIAQAKADPGKLFYGSPGLGTTPHLAMELLKLKAGINVTHVAYGGGGPAMQALVAGTVPVGSMALPNIHAQVKQGVYKGLAVTGRERWPDLSDVPTVEQSGFPGFESETVFTFLAPAGTPAAIIERLSNELIAIVRRPDVTERMQKAGMAVLARGPAALKARIAKEVPEYKDIVAQAGIPVN
jgi:tripartite-type tricarboxylate transporter receptor subunit TctC